MQHPLEERTTALESTVLAHAQTLQRLDDIIVKQDETIDRLLANQEALAANQETMTQLLLEIRRDTAQTQRLWSRLAERYGWFEDEQNGTGA